MLILENENILSNFKLKNQKSWKKFKHTFSHYHLCIQPEEYHVISEHDNLDMKNHTWYNIALPSDIGISAPVKKILNKFKVV